MKVSEGRGIILESDQSFVINYGCWLYSQSKSKTIFQNYFKCLIHKFDKVCFLLNFFKQSLFYSNFTTLITVYVTNFSQIYLVGAKFFTLGASLIVFSGWANLAFSFTFLLHISLVQIGVGCERVKACVLWITCSLTPLMINPNFLSYEHGIWVTFVCSTAQLLKTV